MARAPTHEFVGEQARHSSKAHEWLRRDGWQEGSGIGRNAQGISSALQVKRRTNSGGIGQADDADERNAWWSDGFLLAARKLQRSKQQQQPDDVAVAVAAAGKLVDPLCPLYSRFVYGSVLQPSESMLVVQADDAAAPHSVSTAAAAAAPPDDSAVHDVSRATFEACGGKGGRYLMPEAKLARVKEQDSTFRTKRALEPDRFEDDLKAHKKKLKKEQKKQAKMQAKLEAKKQQKKEARRRARATANAGSVE
jgi:hypothetical protein